MFADMHKLMDSGHSSQNRKIVYDHFTRQLTGIGDDTIITDLTVMSDMGISHNQTIIPDFSNSLSSSAPINSHTFADSRIISDFQDIAVFDMEHFDTVCIFRDILDRVLLAHHGPVNVHLKENQ